MKDKFLRALHNLLRYNYYFDYFLTANVFGVLNHLLHQIINLFCPTQKIAVLFIVLGDEHKNNSFIIVDADFQVLWVVLNNFSRAHRT
ncbi:hypothetical protein T4B_7013 [Trichinella pseudospiralis]|uniref:Uncharacterized protein n=2 Tax=Trichinella pseudospiralis TaxID=6337 RepID=A0A0V1FDN7_TRIPS|nr:hypothetical protein T4D_15852 [Trichinella pseudospiralis]KRZ23865.1 hypothetical protein T4B_7013 [Trichinella pseudospiralis]